MIVLLWWYFISGVEIGLFVGMWVLIMVGMIVGLYCYFVYCVFKISELIRVILVILGCMGV